MHAAAKLALAASIAVAACNRGGEPQNTVDMNAAVANGSAGDIETLPPDESVGTPTDQLANGADNADVDGNVTNQD